MLATQVDFLLYFLLQYHVDYLSLSTAYNTVQLIHNIVQLTHITVQLMGILSG
uniref:Uncharacterized protein n=1 Tax=Arion vulgaris TaxID=1028688 RepID=A0A0B6ZQP7_9EUPU